MMVAIWMAIYGGCDHGGDDGDDSVDDDDAKTDDVDAGCSKITVSGLMQLQQQQHSAAG